MVGLIRSYTRWLHTQWPSGLVEPLPDVRPDGTCAIPGVYVVGDLTGIPLLKFALDSGARAVAAIAADPALARDRQAHPQPEILDLVIIGAGVAGMAAAVEARAKGLRFVVLESAQDFATIANFPARKPIFTYPTEMTPAGALKVSADVKEGLLDELKAQVTALGITSQAGRATHLSRAGGVIETQLASGDPLRSLRVVVAIGRSGDFRRLGVPGEDLAKVMNRLHDPKDYAGKAVLVVGGGDSAIEAAVALAGAGATVTLSYRKAEFSRPKPENVAALNALSGVGTGRVRIEMSSSVKSVADDSVRLALADRREESIPNEAVFALIGREAPLEFFRRSRIPIRGEGSAIGWAAFAAFFAFCVVLYFWKAGVILKPGPEDWPSNMPTLVGGLGAWWSDQVANRATLLGTIATSMKSPSFYYTLAYSVCVVIFGFRRIVRRNTPYITAQTSVLMAVQVVPLFLLPELILPWMGYNRWFDAGTGRAIADALFELYIPAEDYLAGMWPDWGHPRAYWRAYGLILAWPLMVYNVFTSEPMFWWLVIGFTQTFVLIPAAIYFYGKGVYCGWICSCGALAETLGDDVRTRMPHGPFWNRLNMAGQAILLVAFALLGLRIAAWVFPESGLGAWFNLLMEGKNADGALVNPLNYKWVVDITLAGIIGVGLYFKYSGRVWCRFFCPLAALMHVYARFSRFAIVSDKKKCISCNVCTSVCHQGIDIMNFANKGLPMQDPECVRCSACVHSCPTGVLTFGQVARDGRVIALDGLSASPVRASEAPSGKG